MPLIPREKRNAFLFLGLVFFNLVLISVQVPLGSGQTYLERAVLSVVVPLQRTAVSIGQKAVGLLNGYVYLRNVRQQNLLMREELFFLRQENTVLRHALRKLEKEKEIQDRLAAVFRSLRVASVIGMDSGGVFRSILINRGHRDGIRKDMVVLDELGHLVGRVIEPVTERAARVHLITDEESGVGVFTLQTKAVGVLDGDGQGRCRLKYILSTNQNVGTGEVVLTSGFDGIFPSGIRVGRILSITTGSTLFKDILVEPFLDLARLDQVAVLTADLRDVF